MFNTYLIQPNFVSFFGDKKNYWLPYSVGILWSYASQQSAIKDNFKVSKIVFSRENIDSLSDEIQPNSVVVLSSYIWNWEYNKKLAETIKRKCKSAYIIAGGPQITNRPLENKFFKNHPYIDTIILGEGEIAFAECLTNFLKGKIQKIYLSKRLQELDIPSPYLTGIFDQIIQDNPDVVWNTTIETNRGCPFECTFCDWGSATYSKIKKFPMDRINDELEWMGKNRVDYLAFGDANFGIFKDRDMQIAQQVCTTKEKYGYPTNLGLNWNKNSTKHILPIMQTLTSAGLGRGMTISFQSLNDDTLTNIKRKNMEVSNAEEIFQLLEKNNLRSFTELILGLPGETLTSWIDGLYHLLEINNHQWIDVYQTTLLENSELNHPDQREKYQIQTVTIHNFLRSNYELDNAIKEKAVYVKATNTLSTEEMIEAYAFSWMLINLHYSGWTQLYSRFLNSNGISYRRFYNELWSWIIDRKMGVISELYYEFKNNIRLFLDDYQLYEEKNIQDLTANDFIYYQKKMRLEHDEVEQRLENFVLTEFSIVDTEQMENLIAYQKAFVIRYDMTYPCKLLLDHGIHLVIYQNQPYRKDLRVHKIEHIDNIVSKQDFMNKLLTWRRNGWGRAVFTIE